MTKHTSTNTADCQNFDSDNVTKQAAEQAAAAAALVAAALARAAPFITAAAAAEQVAEKASLKAAHAWAAADLESDFNLSHKVVKDALSAGGLAATSVGKSAARIMNGLKIWRKAFFASSELETAVRAGLDEVLEMAARSQVVVDTATSLGDWLTALVTVADTVGGPIIAVRVHKDAIKQAASGAAADRKAGKQPTAAGKSSNGGNNEGGKPESDDSSAVAQSLGAMTKQISLAMAKAYEAPSIAQAVTIMAREWAIATGAEMP